ncbi:MAG: type I restriction endonuclease subunit R [Anaerolineales bacterium]
MPAPNEAKTRLKLIDPALHKAGWNVNDRSQVGLEIPVDGFDPQAWHRLQVTLKGIKQKNGIYEGELPTGISDYALYRPNGEIIAIVEAKKTSIDARLAQAQAEFYVAEIEKRQNFRPFAFMANGRDIYFLDAGQANKREVAGFFSLDDLENLLYLRRNRQPLNALPINLAITNRAYQQEAIRRVCEAFERGQRRALLVMATGTGKTRTAMSLVDVFFKANQARRILFVADRDALVEQSINKGFKKFIANEPCQRVYSGKVDLTKRLFAVTLQTLSNCYADFSPAFFDLIIFDEVHRSIFNKWNDVLDYFDGRMVGLTATPADFIERNTFLEFECPGGIPTYLYTYRQAVQEKYLVDFSLYKAQTKFQREGIRGVDLTEEERNQLIEQGHDPDNIDYSGTDLEKEVSNKDTLRRQWQEIMDQCYKDQSGQLPGKTIVFAMTQDHALRLEDAFNETFPQYPGLARVITHTSNYKGKLIENFEKENLPRIAITVDLLETGVDIPEVVNLVFMRPVQSRIKLEQMIGRGTRSQEACLYLDRLPEGRKKEFLIIDFWENEFNKAPEKEIAQSLPVLVSLFNTRLNLLEQWLDDPYSDEFKRTVADLRAQVALLPTDSLTIRKVLPDIEMAWHDDFWRYVTQEKVDFLRLRVGPLLRYATCSDVPAVTFTSKIERLKLQIATHRDPSTTASSIAEDAGRLKDSVLNTPEQVAARDFCLTPELLTATPDKLTQVIDVLSERMKARSDRPNTFINIDLRDVIALNGYIMLKGGTERVYIKDYRERVEQRVLELIGSHPTIDAISQGRTVSDRQLIELERTLRETLGGSDVELAEENIRKAFGIKVGSLIEFLRRQLDLDALPDYADIVRRQFAEYIAAHPFNANQTLFLRALQNVFLQKRRLSLPDLYDPPLTSFGEDAVERWFTPEQVDDLLAFTERLAV